MLFLLNLLTTVLLSAYVTYTDGWAKGLTIFVIFLIIDFIVLAFTYDR